MNIPSDLFIYSKRNKTLLTELSDLKGYLNDRVPLELFIESVHTGRVVRYVRNVEKEEANEFFDGEEFHFITNEPNVNAKELIIAND